MGAWLKLFTDNTKEHGSDKNIALGKASWTNGRLDNINEVRLFNHRQIASLSVPDTSWHQFDRFIAIVFPGTRTSEVTHRVIQAEIKSHHVGLSLVSSRTGDHFFWAIVQDIQNAKEISFFNKLITKEHIGKWLTVILPEKDYPAVTFSIKGKMHDNQYISR